MTPRMGKMSWLCGIAIVVASLPAETHARPPCPAAPKLEAATISVATKTAADAVSTLLGKLGLDIDVRATRDSVLKDNPRADQAIIVLTMANALCEAIWADSTLSEAEKGSEVRKMMQDVLTHALGPAPIARTDEGPQGRRDTEQPAIVVVSADPGFLLLAQSDPVPELPEPQTGILREPPFYVNDFNKYFVIVGSARARDAGLRLMKQLKAKAPQYDFVLYAPYGNNQHYGVMMATWVPLEVAKEALQLARRDVAADAFLWACRGSGDTC